MSLVSVDSKILVVGGAGTIGSSTALHLARRGYTDIRLLDKFENPSANSAGNDMNKVCHLYFPRQLLRFRLLEMTRQVYGGS